MKKVMKIVAIVLCVALVALTFAACGGTQTPAVDENKVYNIGICQLVQHEALDAATQGFMDKLTELLGEDHVKFDRQNGSGDSNTCTTIVNQFVASNVDLIMANATPALQSAVAATADIPIVATSITDYATALEISDWAGKTGINVTGTSDLAPLDRQAAMFAELVPEAKNIGIVYCSNEANSKYQADKVRAELEAAGCTVTDYTFADSNDISAVVTKAAADSDAIYIPTDNTAANNTELINNIVEPTKTPIIAGEEGICKGCGVATLSISYYDIGVATAEVAYDILVNGKDPADIEIAYAENVAPKYMAERAEALGITVPDTYTAIEVEIEAE